MLNKLQSHIEGEEITWRNQLRIKEKEIEALKQNEISHVSINKTMPIISFCLKTIDICQFCLKTTDICQVCFGNC